MITLKINGIEVSVNKGATILDAAEKAGVFIPTLCHDKRIAPFGSCRLCLVQNRNSPWFVPSCFTPAREGMDIVTDSPEILEAVRRQLQLILINHPLECPTCDKAGECVLQELTTRYNVTELPYRLEESQRHIDRISPLIERDMGRCIRCGRCVRICGELEGKHELEFMNRGIKMFIGTDGVRPLDCDFCGLCLSTCPVGALTDRLFKNSTRVWNLELKETICGHCGLGCPLVLNLEKNDIRRVTTPVYANGRQGFACVRGRFGWRACQEPHRLAFPQVRGVEVSWQEALDFTASTMKDVLSRYGGDSMAVFSSDSLTLEEASAWANFCRVTVGTPHMGSFSAGGYRQCVEQLTATLGPDWKAAVLEDFQKAEVLVVLGGGASELHPVLKQLINIYLRDEDHELVVLSPWRDYFSERAGLSLITGVTPESRERCLAELADALSDSEERHFSDISSFGIEASDLVKLVSLLHGDKEITLVVAPDIIGSNEHLVRLVSVLHDRVRAILPLGAHCNSRGSLFEAGFSGGLLPGGIPPGEEERGISSPEGLLQAIDRGEVKVLYLLGDDPLEVWPDPDRTRAVLEKLDLLVVQSPWETAVAKSAHVLLPSTCIPEKGGRLVSLFGRERTIMPVLPPPGEAKSDGEILEELKNCLAGFGFSKGPVGTPRPRPAAADEPAAAPSLSQQFPQEERSKEFPFVMISVPTLFGDTLIAHRSPELMERKGGLRITMNEEDFTRGGYRSGEEVILSTPCGSASGRVRYSFSLRRNTLMVENLVGNGQALGLVRPGSSVAFANLRKCAVCSEGTGTARNETP